jgi:hypothetical protein
LTANGKRAPFDESPDPKGLFKIDETKQPPVFEYARPGDPPGERFTNHFATCPDRDYHRKKEAS